MKTIEQIASDVRVIVVKAVNEFGPDLCRWSVIDLVMDNVPDVRSTSDAKAALVVAGVDSLLSPRLVRSYSIN